MLDGKVCLVTGAGQGLGQAISKVLAEAGATVVAADIRGDAAERTAAMLGRSNVRPATLDVSDERQASEVVERTIGELGRIDVLVNNAGVDKTVPIEELGFADWDRIMGVNLRGPFVMSKLLLPRMKQQGGGHIVNIASTAAKRAWANASAYHASKWGLLGLSHALHVETRPHGVKVTAVLAGGMRTPFLLDRFPDLDPQVLQDPQNVAETVRFLLTQPAETVIPEVLVLPMRETSWP
ncbi:MAG: short-chain dehydrogenase [Planctomycetota bacterium]|nr:MAG: short-chain dehydrogenase [Planctomycetota bacterium]